MFAGRCRLVSRGFSNLLQKRVMRHALDSLKYREYSTPINSGIIFVPHKEAWVVERMGKFYKVLEPGFNLLIPILDKIKYVQSLKEIAIEIPHQSAVTADNVTLNIDGVLYLKVLDPYLASYGVEDPEYAITQLAQTSMRSGYWYLRLLLLLQSFPHVNFISFSGKDATMPHLSGLGDILILSKGVSGSILFSGKLDILGRIVGSNHNKMSELGKISLDKVFAERESLNIALVDTINKASSSWGISCLRYEIRDIGIPQAVKEAMQLQVEAERKKRAAILESEGIREADINVAAGKRQARILASEADKMEQINRADGEASALLAIAQARAQGLEAVAKSLSSPDGKNAASLNVALQYVSAFNELAQKGNTLILPSNVNDVSQVVAQAMTIYQKITQVKRSDCMDNIENKEPLLEELNEGEIKSARSRN